MASAFDPTCERLAVTFRGPTLPGFTFRDDDKILPGQDSGHGGYSFEENTFEHDDPYHRMIPSINGGTAKYKALVTQIAFDDGTILPKN